MAITHINAVIKNPVIPGKSMTRRFLVDSGTVYSVMLESDLKKLGIKPADKQGFIMHAELKKGDFVFFGSDMMRDKAVIGDNVGVSLECENDEEIQSVFAKLKDGGEVFMAPEEMFWGGVFGMVTDRYGVEWMLNFQKKPMKK